MQHYPTNVNDSQWQVITKILNIKRKRKYDLREIFNGILYLTKTGCQWRLLPKDFPKWELVYYYFQSWRKAGIIEKILQLLGRCMKGRKAQPTVGIIDSQSVKSTLVSSREHTGFDGGKKIKGVKRHIIVDTLGNLLCVMVHPASMADRKGGRFILPKLRERWSKIKKIFADGGYPLPGKVEEKNQELAGYKMQKAMSECQKLLKR